MLQILPNIHNTVEILNLGFILIVNSLLSSVFNKMMGYLSNIICVKKQLILLVIVNG